MANIKELLPITNEDSDLWTNLVGCNDDRWHAPDLQTSKFESVRNQIMEISIWYEKTIRCYYPKLNIIHLNAIQGVFEGEPYDIGITLRTGKDLICT